MLLDKEMDKLNLYYYYLLCLTGIAYSINVLLMIKILNDDCHEHQQFLVLYFIISINETL